MEKPRFSPERNSPQLIQWQKEVYKREEKLLGLSQSPDRTYVGPHLKPKFANVELRRSEDLSGLSSYHKRVKSNLSSNVKDTNANWIPTNRNWNTITKSNNGIASKTKEKYDFNNRSPITWLAKQDLIGTDFSRKPLPGSELVKLNYQLNSKKVLKGMGYMKSNIFVN